MHIMTGALNLMKGLPALAGYPVNMPTGAIIAACATMQPRVFTRRLKA
jgi:hypothetical protein